jgi:hypothetical protein
MMSLQDHIAEAQRNIAAHEAAEKTRIDQLVKEASRQTDVWAAEQALAQRQQEQAQEAAIQAREAQQEARQREDAERRYLAAGGLPADFDSWYVVERQRLVSEKIAQRFGEQAELEQRKLWEIFEGARIWWYATFH